MGRQLAGQLGVLSGAALSDPGTQHLGDEIGLRCGQARHQIAQGAGQFHQPVAVHDIPCNERGRIGEGSDVGAGEHPLLVIDFGEPQCPPQLSRLIKSDASSLGDLLSGIASVAGEQSPGDRLRGRGLVLRIDRPQPSQQRRQQSVTAQPGQFIEPRRTELDDSRHEIGRSSFLIDQLNCSPTLPAPGRRREPRGVDQTLLCRSTAVFSLLSVPRPAALARTIHRVAVEESGSPRLAAVSVKRRNRLARVGMTAHGTTLTPSLDSVRFV